MIRLVIRLLVVVLYLTLEALGNDYLTVPEFASEVRVPVQTVYSWRARGRGPKAYRVGRRLLFRRADVQEWLARQADR